MTLSTGRPRGRSPQHGGWVPWQGLAVPSRFTRAFQKEG